MGLFEGCEGNRSSVSDVIEEDMIIIGHYMVKREQRVIMRTTLTRLFKKNWMKM
jgi:hypothetical protein